MTRPTWLAAVPVLVLAALGVPAPGQDSKTKSNKTDGFECVVSNGKAPWGSREVRPKGETFPVTANAPAKDMAFAGWVGNVEFLADPAKPETTMTLPTEFPFSNIHIGAAYKRVAPKRFVHALFQDHMVLQRDAAVPVWGWTKAGEKVTVVCAGQTVAATAGADGKWIARLAPMSAGGPHTLTVTGPETRTIADVLVGDVWLCAGQSNMAGSGPAKEDAEAANFPHIRLFNNNPGANEYDGADPFDDLADAKAGWKVCTPDAARQWSRVAFYFGRSLHDRHKIPVGLVVTALDGSFIEGWLPKDTLLSMPEYVSNGKMKADYSLSWGAGQMPFIRYNAHVAPLGPFAFRGVLWYQGESNGSERSALRYRKQLELMIRDWRKALGQEKLPFVVVQMHLFGKLDTARPPGDARVPWAELEESQLAVARTVPRVGCAVTTDLAREQSLHPPDKKAIAERATLVARRVAYGEDVPCTGPLYKGMTIEGDAVRLTFDHNGPLAARGGGELRYFAVAGADKKWVWADARIDGDAIVVSSPKVKAPVAVRYAWGTGQQEANLTDATGLPAPAFRTDSGRDAK